MLPPVLQMLPFLEDVSTSLVPTPCASLDLFGHVLWPTTPTLCSPPGVFSDHQALFCCCVEIKVTLPPYLPYTHVFIISPHVEHALLFSDTLSSFAIVALFTCLALPE